MECFSNILETLLCDYWNLPKYQAACSLINLCFVLSHAVYFDKRIEFPLIVVVSLGSLLFVFFLNLKQCDNIASKNRLKSLMNYEVFRFLITSFMSPNSLITLLLRTNSL